MISVRIGIDLYAKLKAQADKEHRSLSNLIITLLEKEMAEVEGQEEQK